MKPLSEEAKAEAEAWQDHQQHEAKYMQTIFDRKAAQDAKRLKQKIKSRLQKRMERTEAYAKQALLKFDIENPPEWTVSVSGSGVGTCGAIPEALRGCFAGGMTLSEISDDAQRAMVAMDVLAFTQYVLNVEEPEAWAMFEISSALSNAISALNDKARRAEYLKQRQHNIRQDKQNWHTQPLIEVCKEIRRGNAPAAQKEMFEILSRRNEEWIDSETDKYGDITVTLTRGGKEPHEMKQDAFNKFEKKHREQIGLKKKL